MVVQLYSGDSGECKKMAIQVYTLERDKSLLQTLWLYTKKIYENQIKIHFSKFLVLDKFLKSLLFNTIFKGYFPFAKSLQLCPTLCDPMDCRLPASLSMGFSRQEYWSGLPVSSRTFHLVITKYWLYTPHCTTHPWAYLTPNSLYHPFSHPYIVLPNHNW